MFIATFRGFSKKVKCYSYPFEQVPFTSVRINQNSFWGNRIRAVRDVTIPLAFSKCKTEGRYDNFIKAAHPDEKYDVSSFMGFPFDDTDVYKTIEGASYVLQTFPDKKLKAYIDSVLDIVGDAQEPDGYLYTARTINPKKPHQWSGKKRWESEEVLGHELYNLGHMVDAACAHYQATGSTKFLNIAERYAECVIRDVGPGKNQTCVVPGHQIAEMALARLYVLTGKRKYLDEAKFFLDYRGKTKIKNSYTQSHTPVVNQHEAVGHAVRAGYMYSGMADVAALTGDTVYIKAIDAIWNNIVAKKYYLTGGVGALHSGEAFGDNYELPNLTAYNETCAAIAMVYFNQRMFMLHGDSKYIDCLERTLYNGVISGMSIDGGKFFYPNPLSSDGKYKFNADNTIERQSWFGCACCPSNLCRFIPSVPGYMYAVRGNSVYVNLFSDNTSTISVGKGDVVLREQTGYPWNGDIRIEIVSNSAGEFDLKIRIPGWVRNQVVPSDLYSYSDSINLNYRIFVNGKSVESKLDAGYFIISKKWEKGDNVDIHFDMKPRIVKANSMVAADCGRVAVECGPIVYCAEWADNDFDIFHFILNKNTKFALNYQSGLLGGVNVITAKGDFLNIIADGSVVSDKKEIKLIPYYSWCHRGPGKMIVWMAGNLGVMDDHR